jgi:hypothetical protein
MVGRNGKRRHSLRRSSSLLIKRTLGRMELLGGIAATAMAIARAPRRSGTRMTLRF